MGGGVGGVAGGKPDGAERGRRTPSNRPQFFAALGGKQHAYDKQGASTSTLHRNRNRVSACACTAGRGGAGE